jgi:hypothetical protein
MTMTLPETFMELEASLPPRSGSYGVGDHGQVALIVLAPLLAAVLLIAPPPLEGDLQPIPSSGLETDGPLQTSELTTARFRIVYTPRAKASAQILARELESARDEIAALLGSDWPGVTEVRLGFGREEYEAFALPNLRPPSWAIALAYPGRNIVLVEAHSLVTPEGPLTLRHELVHVALGQFGKGWPHWFQEGLAQELTGERKWKTEQIATLTRAVTTDRVFDFDDLTERFPSYPSDVEIAYAQSAAFVEFLRARHGTHAFQRLITRVGQGDNFEKAFGVAFYLPLSMEEDAFKRELPRKYPWWPLLLSGGTLVWVVSSVLLVMAFFRRRKVVKALRAEQLRVETLHEAAKALLRASPVNEDTVLDEFRPFEGTPMPFTVNIVLTEPGAPATVPAAPPVAGSRSRSR